MLRDRRNAKSRKKNEGYRYAGGVKQNRNETVKRRFDGTPIKARDDENLFYILWNSSWSNVPFDYRAQSAKTIIRKNAEFFEGNGTRRRIVKIIRTRRVSRNYLFRFFLCQAFTYPRATLMSNGG